MIAGVGVGIVTPEVGKSLGVLGTMFVALIKMMIAPVIFCTIVLGIGSVRKAATVGKVGGLALGYFVTMSTFALGIGLVVGNIVSPVPVTLNGRDQQVEIDLEDIAYTMTPGSDLSLQIFTTATPFLNFTQFGFVHIDSVEVTLPTTSAGVNQGPNLLPA